MTAHVQGWRSGLLRSLVFVACAALLPAAARPDDELIEFLPKWKTGDHVTYELTKSIKRQSGRTTIIDRTLRFDLDVRVKKTTDVGFSIGWKLGKARFEKPGVVEDITVDTLTQAMAGIEIAIDIGVKGSPLRLQNWAEARQQVRAKLERFLKVATEFEATLEKVTPKKNVRSNASRIKRELAGFDTREQVEGFLLKQPVVFFLVVGMKQTKGEKFEYHGAEPNIYGGEPFPCSGWFELKSLDAPQKRAVVVWKQSLDAEQAGRIMEKTSKELQRKAGTKPTKGEWPRTLELDDNAEFTIDLLTGWPVRISHSREAKANEITHRDTVEVRRK
jgi:hypothetical protein